MNFSTWSSIAEQYVLQGFPWNEYRVLTMTVEETDAAAAAILEARGYHKLFTHRHDDMWVLGKNLLVTVKRFRV